MNTVKPHINGHLFLSSTTSVYNSDITSVVIFCIPPTGFQISWRINVSIWPAWQTYLKTIKALHNIHTTRNGHQHSPTSFVHLLCVVSIAWHKTKGPFRQSESEIFLWRLQVILWLFFAFEPAFAWCECVLTLDFCPAERTPSVALRVLPLVETRHTQQMTAWFYPYVLVVLSANLTQLQTIKESKLIPLMYCSPASPGFRPFPCFWMHPS